MKKLTFWRLLELWLFAALALLLVNGFTLQSSLAHSLILASLGFTLLVHPAYPSALERAHDAAWCRRFIRILAATEIAASLLVRTSF